MNEYHSVNTKISSSGKNRDPRMKPKEIRKHEIQVAARKVFFKKGYQHSTIAEIAKMVRFICILKIKRICIFP